MSNELMKIQFQPEQVELIKKQIAPNATDNELKLFLYQAQRTGLDPLTRQIYCIHRKVKDANGNYVQKMTIQTSIDGFRVIAERSGSYAGQSEPEFTEKDNRLISAKVTVYRFAPNGDRYPASVGVAYWEEYAQEYNGKLQGLWAKMPRTMLAKVAEALALRKAYPQDLSGLYTSEEMNQADKPEMTQEEFVDYVFFDYSDEKQDKLLRLTESSSYDHDQRRAIVSNINDKSTMTEAKYNKIYTNLLANQLGIEGVQNPSATDIRKHVKKIANAQS